MTIPFEHGVAVFARGDEVAGGALSLPGLEPFSQQLPADVAQLRGWVTGGPGRLLTAIVAGGWDFSLIVELRRLAPAVYVIVWHADAVEDAHNRWVASRVTEGGWGVAAGPKQAAWRHGGMALVAVWRSPARTAAPSRFWVSVCWGLDPPPHTHTHTHTRTRTLCPWPLQDPRLPVWRPHGVSRR